MGLLRDLAGKHEVRLTGVVYPWPNQIAVGDRNSRQLQYWRSWTAANGVGLVDLFDELLTAATRRDDSRILYRGRFSF